MLWIICLSLLPIIYQDFKAREIYIGFLLCFIFSSMIWAWKTNLGFDDWGMNLGFLVFIMISLSLYFSIKNRAWINIVDHSLGLGDIVFFLGLCFLFPFVNMVAFFTFSLIFSITFMLIWTLFRKEVKNNIPLAGLMGIFLLGILLLHQLNYLDISNQNIILSKLNTIYGLE